MTCGGAIRDEKSVSDWWNNGNREDCCMPEPEKETGALANRDRLMKVSLRDKTVSVEKDGISLMAGNGSVPNIFEF